MITSDLTVPRKFVGLGLIALAVIVLAGCGSSSSPTQTTATDTTTAPADTGTATTTTAATMTREEFVAKLDDICKRANAVSAKYQTEYNNAAKARDYTAAANARDQNRNALRPFDADTEKLVPPPALEATFDRYKAIQRRVRALDEQIADAQRARDSRRIQSLAEPQSTLRRERTETAIDLGTTYCGQ